MTAESQATGSVGIRWSGWRCVEVKEQ